MIYTFHQTCSACPDQYDVYVAGRQVAYARLRWGEFTVEAPDVGGKEIYEGGSDDGEYAGGRFSAEEREKELQAAADAIADHYGFFRGRFEIVGKRRRGGR